MADMTNFSRNDIVEILKDDKVNDKLFESADEIRKQYVGNDVHLRGLIEFSNICKCHCKYCGLRSDNKSVKRYRMSPEAIIECARNAVNSGYRTIVLQSGEDNYFSKDILCEIIKEIKIFDTAVTLSLGERTYEDYKAFKEAGADRYLLRIETTDRDLYKIMHPGSDFDNRLRCLKDLKKLGYETGTGCLVGLPGQTPESLADDILFFKEIDADMVGIGPFIPHPDTPLGMYRHGDFILALKVMALTRIVLKNVNIPATTAMETLNPNGQILALQSGANVIMPNVTFDEYKENYEIYPDKFRSGDRLSVEEKIKSIRRTVAQDYGFRKQ